MLKVGITGGIGSGKSIIAKIFATLGIPVYDADTAARRLMDTDPVIKNAITGTFGSQAYTATGLNRSYIASVVFNDADKLRQLNAITHPATIADANRWFDQQHAPYALKEAALIFESASHQYLDYVIGVWSPQELRVERVVAREHTSPDQVLDRIKKQMNEDEKMKRCNFVIDNSGSVSVIEQVMQVHNKLLERAIFSH